MKTKLSALSVLFAATIQIVLLLVVAVPAHALTIAFSGDFSGASRLVPTATPNVFAWSLNGTGTTNIGGMSVSEQATVDFSDPLSPIVSDGLFSWTLDGGLGTVSGTYFGTAKFTPAIGFTFAVDYFFATGGGADGTETTNLNASVASGSFDGTITDVGAAPLPAALPLFASGLGAFGLFGWRRKKKSAIAAINGKSGKLIISSLAGIFFCTSQAAATTYTVNAAGGSATIAGTITTDGTFGVLTIGNLTDWNLVIDFGGGFIAPLTGPLSGNNSGIALSGILSATPAQLLFDFGNTDINASEFEIAQLGTLPVYGVLWLSAANGKFPNSIDLAFVPTFDGNDEVDNVTSLSPNVLPIAEVATPLPAALPLFAGGLGALGFLGWRRKKRAAAG